MSKEKVKFYPKTSIAEFKFSDRELKAVWNKTFDYKPYTPNEVKIILQLAHDEMKRRNLID